MFGGAVALATERVIFLISYDLLLKIASNADPEGVKPNGSRGEIVNSMVYSF